MPSGSKIFLGPKFALLRREFSEIRAKSLKKRRSLKINTIMITMGGVDEENYTSQVINALNHSCWKCGTLKIIIVMGLRAPHIEAVKKAALQLPWEVEVLVGIGEDMAKKMAASDLVISSAGSTLWEICCLGLASLIMVAADNQRRSANYLASMNCITLLTGGKNLKHELEGCLDKLDGQLTIRQMQTNASLITDGRGARLMAAEILSENF